MGESAGVESPPSLHCGGWLVAKGEMGRAIADHAWAQTPLGALESWPSNLRLLVNLMLEAAAPMAVIWGRQFRFLYNDPYRRMIHDKHPGALGAPGGAIFPELWGYLLPLFERALAGEAVLIEDQVLAVSRGGVATPGYFSFSYNPIRGNDGCVDGFLAIVVETTDRVVREQQRALMFDTVLSAITDFAYSFDREGRFLYVNKALLDLWGLKLEDAVGKNFFDLKYPDELAARLQAQIRQVFEGRATLRDETRYVSPTGVEGYYEYIFSPVFAPDGTVSIVAGSTRDITARKKLEIEAQAAAKAKDYFLATLSHELRTPLNPVLLLATEGATNPDVPEEIRSDFNMIAENVTLEARLIDDLLDITRIAHDKMALDLRTHDMHALLRKVIDAVEPEVRGKDIVLRIRLEAPRSVVVGDEVRLRQIFWNLVRNAAKFTPSGGNVTVSTRIRPERPEVLLIEISDTGIGMTPAELSRVFTPFAQGEHGTDRSTQFGGLGLGLAIARKLAELHAGSISARSPGRNQGSTFEVELALEPLGGPPG